MKSKTERFNSMLVGHCLEQNRVFQVMSGCKGLTSLQKCKRRLYFKVHSLTRQPVVGCLVELE